MNLSDAFPFYRLVIMRVMVPRTSRPEKGQSFRFFPLQQTAKKLLNDSKTMEKRMQRQNVIEVKNYQLTTRFGIFRNI